MVQISENQIRKIDEGIVVDLPVQILACKPGVHELPRHFLSLLRNFFFLLLRECQFQFAYVVERVTDLMIDAEGDQNIRGEISVHMRVKIAVKLEISGNIGLEDRLGHIELIVLRLTHQCLGNRRNRSLHFHVSVRINIRHLGAAKAKNIHFLIIRIDIAGNLPPDNEIAVFIFTER